MGYIDKMRTQRFSTPALRRMSLRELCAAIDTGLVKYMTFKCTVRARGAADEYKNNDADARHSHPEDPREPRRVIHAYSSHGSATDPALKRGSSLEDYLGCMLMETNGSSDVTLACARILSAIADDSISPRIRGICTDFNPQRAWRQRE